MGLDDVTGWGIEEFEMGTTKRKTDHRSGGGY